MELVDTHCHLFLPPLAARLEPALARARERGVTRVVVPAYDLASWASVQSLAGRPGLHAALGLHPWVAAEPLELAALEAALRRAGAVAVGEIGLDLAIEGADRVRQLELLDAQLGVARALGLPVILHCRAAFEELIALLAPHAPVRGVVHAFSKGPELARRLLDLGLHLAFGGAVTRPRAERARRSATLTPQGRLLLETDAPSIGLEGVPPEQVEPEHVRDVAEALATLRGEPLEELAAATTANARALFQLP